jgi:hypothetical protein
MEQLAGIVITIACGCILPIFGIWWGVRQKMNETNRQTEIILAAIEKNPDMDIEELIKKISPKKKLLKEKLLSKLLSACITTFLGIALLAAAIWVDCMGGMEVDHLHLLYIGGFVLLAVGIAFLINYNVGKKMLVKEMEAEEQNTLLNS